MSVSQQSFFSSQQLFSSREAGKKGSLRRALVAWQNPFPAEVLSANRQWVVVRQQRLLAGVLSPSVEFFVPVGVKACPGDRVGATLENPPDLFGSRQGRNLFCQQDVFSRTPHPPTQPDRVSGYRSHFPPPGGGSKKKPVLH